MITRNQFDYACKAFIHEGNNDWVWKEHPSFPGFGYMTRTVLLPSHHVPATIDSSDELVEAEDDAVLSQSHAQHITSNQHVVYSSTFQVPTFYFTMHDSHGSPLALLDILRTSLFRHFALEDTSLTPFAVSRVGSSFPLLSQGDHPSLGTPCWYLHPCETPAAVGELVAEVQAEAPHEDWTEERRLVRLLKVWFMVLSAAVDIHV